MDKPSRYILNAFIIISVLNGLSSERIVLKTRPSEKIYNFFPLYNDYIEFDVRAASDIHILLSETYEYFGKFYELALGGWKNTRSVIRRDHTDNVVASSFAKIANGKEFDRYWVMMDRDLGTVSVGKAPSKEPILHYSDNDFVNVTYVGFSTGFGSAGEWFIDSNFMKRSCQECECNTIRMYY